MNDGTTRGDLIKKQQAKNYQPVNGCTHTLSMWQIMAIAVLTAIQILNFDLIWSMVELKSILLYVLFGLSYLLLIVIVIDYLALTFSDPADPRLKNSSFSEPNQKLKKCNDCKINVEERSYHCKTCQRCVEEFDHHCVFLNNCIGKQNYSRFLRLLLTLISHTSINMGIGLSMYVQLNDFYRWVALAYAILSFLVFVEIAVLAVFHCYISFVLYKTTLEVLRGDKKVQNSNEKPRKMTINVETIEKCQTKPVENTLPQEPTQVAFQKHSFL